MRYRLSNNGHYSASERELFSLLGSKPKSSSELLDAWWGNKVPFNGRVRMLNIMRSLQRKVEYNGENFKIVRSPRAGPNPVSYHLNGK